MSSIVDNNNVLKYLTKNKEIKSFKKIEKIIGRSVKIKDLRSLNFISEVFFAQKIGIKTFSLLIKYIDIEEKILLNYINNSELKSAPHWSKRYNFYKLLSDLDINNSHVNLKNLILSKNELKASELSQDEIEKSIIKNIETFFLTLNNRDKIIFSSYYGYKTEILTLESTADKISKIENKTRVSRERVRQLLNEIKSRLKKSNNFDLKDLVQHLEEIQNQGFHNYFPKLDKILTDTVKTKKTDISGDRLNQFLADFTGKDKNHYKTPELLLKKEFNKDLLIDIFLELPYGVSEDLFISEIKTLFGFDEIGAKRAVKFMDDNNLILHKDSRIYPLSLSAFEEVAHICLKFPKGIYWKDIYEILNNSPSKNNFSLSRLVADHKISENEYLWLCAKGTHKHIKYLRNKEFKDDIISSVHKVLVNKGKKALRLNEVFNSIKSNNLLEKIELTYHELRAFIKIFGREKGIFWKGKSNVDTVSLSKNFNYLKNKDNVLDIINKSSEAIHEKQIIKLMDRGTDMTELISVHGVALIREKKVMRVGPKLWFNYEKALKLCDINLLKEETIKLFDKFNTVSLYYITIYLNTKLNLALSYYYYDSIFETIDKDLKLFFSNSYISKDNVKFTTEKIYKEYFQDNLDIHANVKNIASVQRIAVSPQQFVNAKYYYG